MSAPGVKDFELPPPESYEPQHTGKSNGQARPSTQSNAFEIHRLDELKVAPRAAIVQGLSLDEGGLGAMVGVPNAGKTALAISLVLHVAARAERWLGLKIAGGPVVYFASEAPGSVYMRAKAAAQRLGFGLMPLYISSAAPGLGGEYSTLGDTDRIIATVRAVESQEGERVRLVGIDTLAACLADGDENGAGMLLLVNAAKRIALETGALVLLIHHPAKADAASLRGHGSLAAACDAILRIDVEDITGVRTATLVKARDAAAGLQLRFELEQVVLEERDSFGDPLTTIVVKPTSQPKPRPRPSGKRQQELLAELERRHRTGERAWDEASICKAGRDLGMHRNSPRDALRGLVHSGYITGSAASYALKHAPEDIA